MGSKVPGAVVTDPPTAKLPCSWIISGSGLLLLVSCAPAEVKRKTAISQRAMIDFRCCLLTECARVTLMAGDSRLLFPGFCFCLISPRLALGLLGRTRQSCRFQQVVKFV